MGNRLLNVSDAEAKGVDILELFDKELRTSLVGGDTAIAICLRPEMSACAAIIDWLSKWQQNFSKSNRQFIIVAADPVLLQYLELSHPDEHLTYVTSIEELFRKYPHFNTVEPAVGQPGPVAPVAPLPGPASVPPAGDTVAPAPPLQTFTSAMPHEMPIAPAQPRPREPARPAQQEQPRLQQKIMAGQMAKISGEYACSGCGTTRMYARGDTAGECTNPECPNHAGGWKLVFELF